MDHIDIDPSEGIHAVADLTNEAMEYLVELVLWELAVRTDRDQFEECLRRAIARRGESETQVQELRNRRDLARFAAEVMADIERLPGTNDRRDTPTTGMYL